tara:strand:- start:2359 stop:3660 length:1302 start_codon:yes stop_codon:yes gene_type:complete
MLLGNKQLTEEDRLTKAVVRILGEPKYVAMAGVIMIGSKTIGEEVPTAYTNGKDEVYGRKFVAVLSDAELRGLILHENYHKLYRHLTTWKNLWDIDPELANMACDYVINIKIVDENPPEMKDGKMVRFAVLPEGGLIDERFRGMSAAEVFNILRKEQSSKPKPRRGNGEGGGGGGDSSAGNPPDTTPDNESGQDGNGGGLDEHDWEGANELTPDEVSELERDIDEAIRQGALAAGKMGVNVSRDIEDLLQPQVDWREVLREFVKSTCAGKDFSTWARPNRRFLGQGVYLPSGISERVEELVLAIDTSGSIGQRALTLFLTEVKAICDTVKPDKVRLLYWGSRVVADESYELSALDDLVKSTKPRGGGGTDVECVVEYMRDNKITPQATIVLTDGDLYGGWGKWDCPVLWAILDNEDANPDVGKRVHIKSGEME